MTSGILGACTAASAALAIAVTVALSAAPETTSPRFRSLDSPTSKNVRRDGSGAPRALPELGGDTLAYWQRFALNGLLEPLLEADDPLRWAPPRALMPCADSATVDVDGAAPEPGAPLAEAPFTVRWRLDHCLPFGPESIGLSGEIEMRVHRRADRIEARVTPRGLVLVDVDGRAWTTNAPFDASLRLLPEPTWRP